MTKKIRKSLAENPCGERGLASKISDLVAGLFYISEIDAAIDLFAGEEAEEVTGEEILRQIGGSENTQVRENSTEYFFSPLMKVHDGYGEAEEETAFRFRNLNEFLESNLEKIKVFRIGPIQVEIYVVGLDKTRKLMGVRTKAVET